MMVVSTHPSNTHRFAKLTRAIRSTVAIGLTVVLGPALVFYLTAPEALALCKTPGCDDLPPAPPLILLPEPPPPPPQRSPFDESCVAAILNRTTQVDPDGTFGFRNLPLN